MRPDGILERREEGVADLRQAVVQGSIDRLVPILMTALSTGLALVPVALDAGEPGSEIQAPMANVIIFGLISSTALNMVVVPAAYYALHTRKKLRASYDLERLGPESEQA